MSAQAQGWAWKVRTGNPTLKAVLVAVANYADENGLCWPSQARLARDTELSERTIARSLASLEEAGVIERTRRSDEDGYRTSDMIRLNHAYGRESPVGPKGLTDTVSGRTPPTGHSRQKTCRESQGNLHRTSTSLSSLRSEREPTNVVKLKRKTRLTEDFTLTEQRLTKGLAKGLSEEEVRHEFGKFQDHFIGTGTAWVDWDRCWSKWLATAVERGPRKAALSSGGREAFTEFQVFKRYIANVQDRRGDDGRDEVALPF